MKPGSPKRSVDSPKVSEDQSKWIQAEGPEEGDPIHPCTAVPS